VCQVSGEPSEIYQDLVHRAIQTHSLALITLHSQRVLEHHGMKLAKKRLPFVDGITALLGDNGVQHLKKVDHPVHWELNGHGTGMLVSPFGIFLNDSGACQWMLSFSSRRRNISSNELNKMHLIFWRCSGPPCVKPIKSSTYISQVLTITGLP
jgi:hypothetical protein